MPRIRTIKPEFPQSESIGRLSRDARLLFLQLFTLVDDAGRTRASSRMLASLLYPYDDDASGLMNGWLDELEREGHIRRYVVDDTKYLELRNWLKHQKIAHPAASRLPAFPESSEVLMKPHECSRSLMTDLNPNLNLVSGPRTLTAEEKSGNRQERGNPRQGAISKDGKFIYFKRGSKEFNEYAAEYLEVIGDEPNATGDGRWFKWTGELADKYRMAK